MSTYQQQTERNAQQTAARAAVVVEAYQAGRVDSPELPVHLSTVIRVGASRGVALADANVSAELSHTIGRLVPTTGQVLPPQTQHAISDAVATILSEGNDVPTRVARLAAASPLDSANVAYQDAAEAQGVEGWVREVHPDCCPICQGLATGVVIPITKRFKIAHPHDRCVPKLVLTGAKPGQRPETGPRAPEDFAPRTLTTGVGIAGKQYRVLQPGLRVTRSVFVPAARVRSGR